MLAAIGIGGSIIYTVVLFLLVRDKLPELYSLKLNEIGDFFAGAFGPLAIYWLIIGFLQQGLELKLNTKALELQAKELKDSVEQQKELVAISEKQFASTLQTLEYERELHRVRWLPKIVPDGSGWEIFQGKDNYLLKMINIGEEARDVLFKFDNKVSVGGSVSYHALKKGENISIELRIIEEPNTIEKIDFSICYEDFWGKKLESEYYINFEDEGLGRPASIIVNKVNQTLNEDAQTARAC